MLLALEAFLFFWAELILGRALLPNFGGAPAVWTTAMLFFQAMVLAGYLLARSNRRPIIWILLSLSMLFPLQLRPTELGHPIADILATLTLTAALPMIALAAVSPIAATSSRSWAAGSIGSLLGLLAPLLFDRYFDLDAQLTHWRYAFIAFAFLSLTAKTTIERSTPAWRPIFYAFIPASLLFSATELITTDLASAPLLWIAPLAIYLATLAIAFGHPAPRNLVVPQTAVLIFVATLHYGDLDRGSWLTLVLHLVGFALTAQLFHDRLIATEAKEIHLPLAIGGLLAGLFALTNKLIPIPIEYPLVAAISLLPRDSKSLRVPVAAAIAVFAAAFLPLPPILFLIIALAAGYYVFEELEDRSRAAFLLFAMLVVDPSRASHGIETLHLERSFFAVHRVVRDSQNDRHLLEHGPTIHGTQTRTSSLADQPTAYHHPSGPAGDLFRALPPHSRVAVAGLGAGALACYRHDFTFYELDPAVVRIAKDPELFSYLDLCAPNAEIILGDARLTLSGHYRLIVLDAFSSDAVPIHLMTREAIDLYLDHLEPDGFLAFNVSSHYVDLTPVLAGHARARNLVALIRDDRARENPPRDWAPSVWVVLARSKPVDWPELTVDPIDWTDQRSSLLDVVTFGPAAAPAPDPSDGR